MATADRASAATAISGWKVTPVRDHAAGVGSRDAQFGGDYVAYLGLNQGEVFLYQISTGAITQIKFSADAVLEIRNNGPPDAAYADWGLFYGWNDPNHGYNAHLAEFNELLNGLSGNTSIGIWAWQPATRGEVAQIRWNLMNKAGLAG